MLALIAHHYFGKAGSIILIITVTLACLKTAVGLITSCSETFSAMFSRGPRYRVWAVIFCIVSFLIANLGLTSIIAYAVPVLMFLYPLAITLILLSLFGKGFSYDRKVYAWTTGFTLVAAVFDLIKALASTLPAAVVEKLHLTVVVDAADKVLPFFDLGLGWILPAAVGAAIGLVLHAVSRRKQR